MTFGTFRVLYPSPPYGKPNAVARPVVRQGTATPQYENVVVLNYDHIQNVAMDMDGNVWINTTKNVYLSAVSFKTLSKRLVSRG